MTDIYDLNAETITGETISLSEYREQALLIVNLASQ
jgi:glutathione peroxidase-family protein|tara:strand:- start:1661 stop:1768 length:108 start_codon:yes stop_codon:yes gene_type:complete